MKIKQLLPPMLIRYETQAFRNAASKTKGMYKRSENMLRPIYEIK